MSVLYCVLLYDFVHCLLLRRNNKYILCAINYVNRLMATLKPQSNGYSNTVIGTLLVGGLLHLVQRGGAWAGCGPAQTPHRCTKCNSRATHQLPVYQLHIIRCGTIIALNFK